MSYNELREGRVSLPNHYYHVTMVSQHRLPLFTDSAIAQILTNELQQTTDINSIAWVIMPDHLHWLLQIVGEPMPAIIKRFKGRTARAINIHNETTGSVWQKAYHDHALREDEDIKTTARYIITNPLRAGLADKVQDYPWWWTIWAQPNDDVKIDP